MRVRPSLDSSNDVCAWGHGNDLHTCVHGAHTCTPGRYTRFWILASYPPTPLHMYCNRWPHTRTHSSTYQWAPPYMRAYQLCMWCLVYYCGTNRGHTLYFTRRQKEAHICHDIHRFHELMFCSCVSHSVTFCLLVTCSPLWEHTHIRNEDISNVQNIGFS
jgi:hypothetical protein